VDTIQIHTLMDALTDLIVGCLFFLGMYHWWGSQLRCRNGLSRQTNSLVSGHRQTTSARRFSEKLRFPQSYRSVGEFFK